MSNFKTHFSFGLSIAMTFAICSVYFLSTNFSLSIGIFLAFLTGSILPDLDIKHSKPSKIISLILSFLVTIYTFSFVKEFFASANKLSFLVSILFSILLGLFLYFLIPYLIKNYTIHRGIFHSTPAIFFVFFFTYFLISRYSKNLALHLSIAISSGYFLHLLIDELNGLKNRKRKKSVFKIRGENSISTFIIYILILILFIYFIIDLEIFQVL